MERTTFYIIIVVAVFSLTVVPTAIGQSGSCEIEFTYVPPIGSSLDLEGRVICEDVNDCNDYNVVVYIYVPDGWWAKPYWNQRLTSIAPDCSWTCDITIGGQDWCATKVIAFLVPKGYEPDQNSGKGEPCLYSELYDFPYIEAFRYKTISFSGYDWWVKRNCSSPIGPGPNNFSDSNDNVWVDPDDGDLHLKITHKDGKWNCAEVIANLNVGYGSYIFTVEGRVDLMDENIVLGLFSWEDCVPEYDYREIDFEFTRWGDPYEPNNAQFVVLPSGGCNGIYRFSVDCSVQETFTNIFTWSPGKISFRSYYGDFSLIPADENMITSWIYNGSDVPPPGQENPRINFWLMNGWPPVNGQEAEIVIKKFLYLPDTRAEIDLVDFDVLAGHWLKTNCGMCYGTDFTADGKVDFNDLEKLVLNWLVLPY